MGTREGCLDFLTLCPLECALPIQPPFSCPVCSDAKGSLAHWPLKEARGISQPLQSMPGKRQPANPGEGIPGIWARGEFGERKNLSHQAECHRAGVPGSVPVGRLGTSQHFPWSF